MNTRILETIKNEELLIQGEAAVDENDAFCSLVDRYRGGKAIFLAGRNYESYNGFEHVVRSGNRYLVRVRDVCSKPVWHVLWDHIRNVTNSILMFQGL